MTRKLRQQAWGWAGVALFVVALILLYPDFVRMFLHKSPARSDGLPPAFSGNRAAYGFALFSLFTMSSLAIRKLISLVCQLRDENWREQPDVGLYRVALCMFLSTMLLGASGDVVLMMLWGEAGPEMITAAMTFDRVCDGLTIFPFIGGILIILRAEQMELVPIARLTELLDRPTMTARERAFYLVLPRSEGLGDTVRVIVMVAVIALGLALYK